MIIFLVGSMLASKGISEPLMSVSFSVIKLFTRSELVIGSSLVFLIAVLNVSFISELTKTPVSLLGGSKSETEGA